MKGRPCRVKEQELASLRSTFTPTKGFHRRRSGRSVSTESRHASGCLSLLSARDAVGEVMRSSRWLLDDYGWPGHEESEVGGLPCRFKFEWQAAQVKALVLCVNSSSTRRRFWDLS